MEDWYTHSPFSEKELLQMGRPGNCRPFFSSKCVRDQTGYKALHVVDDLIPERHDVAHSNA